MKKVLKRTFCAVLAAVFVFSLSGCAKVSYVMNGAVNAIEKINDGTWQEGNTLSDQMNENEVLIDPFAAGTYGSIEFKTEADDVDYYVKCYDNTKSQTAEYIDADGNKQTYYAFVSEESLKIEGIYIDGKKNEMLNNLVPGIVDGAFVKGSYGLPPSNNINPLIDNYNMDADNPGEYDYRKSYFKPDYCLACNVKENSDGTITITIQPKAASMAARGADSQGSFFEVLKDLGQTVSDIFNDFDALSWASGSTDENCVVNYSGGTGEVTIDPKTDTIISADYHMCVLVEVNHANVTVIKDKSGAINISHFIHYPASDDYLKQNKKLTKV